MRNVEFKARLADFAGAENAARALGAKDGGWLEQEDTYFHAPHGRLKLRREKGAAQGQLVSYRRADEAEARLCAYELVPIADAEGLKQALAKTLGIRVTVRKRRRLFLWENVRIHLDRVEGLGEFLELEAVLADPDDPVEAERKVAFLRERLGISPRDILPDSYADMVERERCAQIAPDCRKGTDC